MQYLCVHFHIYGSDGIYVPMRLIHSSIYHNADRASRMLFTTLMHGFSESALMRSIVSIVIVIIHSSKNSTDFRVYELCGISESTVILLPSNAYDWNAFNCMRHRRQRALCRT
ncbi:hypothetical protein T12_8431 [Trichinella patagoniensis]|uniref:Uncharacterized protein n=1 Tax=Trichinella patagoniensis TaxID=990121 RepID=A0A0V0Z9E6_9BILA|nr:hypothetical protein T12_8431 [Trichinella patagoniensis]